MVSVPSSVILPRRVALVTPTVWADSGRYCRRPYIGVGRSIGVVDIGIINIGGVGDDVGNIGVVIIDGVPRFHGTAD